MIALEHTREQVLSGTATVLSCVVVLIWCTALAAQQDKDAARAKTIINRILAREEAITSAGFVYCRSGVWLREGALKIDEGPIQFSVGFALPLVEYVSRAGDVQTSFLCSGFREVGDGIFFPRSVTRSTATGVNLSYSIGAMETVNQVTSRDDIDVVLPEGTMILGANEIGLLGVRLDRDTPASELTAKIEAARARRAADE